ncbi:hypothetical protein DL764_002049 [Monosporascus ibericus]|uniref:Uncharacterized protein n=1 Tax=Monosporascus ibericus TaxID=155417 RepID=A0A4Q4TPL4_9PEZI|nr:hypothetical protein DL764_002049 [Monosporascus ibericus]
MGYRRKRPKTAIETLRSLDIDRVLEVAKTILLKLRSLASSDNATLKAGLAVLILLFGPTWPILLAQRLLGISETAPKGRKSINELRRPKTIHPPRCSSISARSNRAGGSSRQTALERQDSQTKTGRNDRDKGRARQSDCYPSSSNPQSIKGSTSPANSRPPENAMSLESQIALPAPPQRTHRSPASTSNSTRRLSASFMTDGPLTSNPTTAYSSIIAPKTCTNLPAPRGTLSSSKSSNLPLPESYRPGGRRASPTNIPLPEASIATSYATATVVLNLQRENIALSASYASVADTRKDSLDLAASRMLPKVSRSNSKQKHKARPNIPRSRTLDVFSNITHSLSRSSLASFTRNDSRHPSNSTTATKSTVGAADSSTTESRFGISTSTFSSIRAIAGNTSPAKIRMAQPSAYWTGRFVALHDRFRSEMLLPENLPMAISAEAERAPSKVTMTGLPAAATTGSIPPPRQLLRTSSSSGNAFAHHLETTATTASNKRKHKQTASFSSTKSTTTVTATTMSTTLRKPKPGTGTCGRDDVEGEADLPLTMHDEHRRSRRAFQHLEGLCETDEARRSLHAWQQTYARRVDCEALLPRGWSMDDHRAGGGWVGRLLGAGGVGVGVGGKRTSMPSFAVGGVAGGGGVNWGSRGYGGKRGSFAL